jgi:hypothetical protein
LRGEGNSIRQGELRSQAVVELPLYQARSPRDQVALAAHQEVQPERDRAPDDRLGQEGQEQEGTQVMGYLTPEDEHRLTELMIGGVPIKSAIVQVEQLIGDKVQQALMEERKR